MNRRGVTLLELLVVIGLLLALGSLVFPSVLAQFHERAFESSVEVVRNQLLLARAHAQATGEPVEVFYRAVPPSVEARRFPIVGRDLAPAQPARRTPAVADGEALDLAPPDEDESAEAELMIGEGWAFRELARRVWIADQPPSSLEADLPGALVATDVEGWNWDGAPAGRRGERGAEPAWIRLAVFLPDGSALLGDPVWIGDEDGRIRKLLVNPWTGLPSLGSAEPEDGDLGEETEPQDPAP